MCSSFMRQGLRINHLLLGDQGQPTNGWGKDVHSFYELI